MGRAGAGGHSGGRSMSSHSSSRRTSSHHVSRPSSGSRAGGGSFHSSFGGGSPHRHSAPPPPHHYGYGAPPPPHYGYPCPPPPPRHYRRHYCGDGERFISVGSFIGYWFILMLIIIGIANAMHVVSYGGASIPKSTYNREKAETGVAFNNDCIMDELGWFDNIALTERQLQSFYNATGIQPYIALFGYNPALKSDADCEAFAEDWYSANIGNEGTLLFAYFAEEDTDNDVGTMTLVNGKQISSVMDSEAVEIFWAYVDEYWYSDLSTDDLFVKVFDMTAKRIMTKTATGADVGKILATGVVILIGGAVVVVIMNKKRAHEKARNEETARILNTDIKDIEDETVNKYL